MNWLSTTNKIFSNAENREHKPHVIRFLPVQKIISHTGRCFINLKDEEDDSVKSLKWFLWNLRQAVTLSLLPFNSNHIGLNEMIARLETLNEYFPTTRESVSAIIEASKYLLDNPSNPKRDKVFEILGKCSESREKHALVSLLSRGRVFGWDEKLYDEIKRVSPHCIIITTKKILISNAFDTIIIPSGGKSSPISNELLNGSYGRVTETIAYEREHTFYPVKKSLPQATKSYKSIKTIDSEYQYSEPGEENVVDWEAKQYWESFRERYGLENATDHGRQYVVKARLVLLPGSKIVYLRDDVKVINLTSIVGESSSYLAQLKKFPRSLVKNLAEGDLIVLRTAGSGEYLLDVANMLMQKDGKSDLRKDALEWKPYLKKALEDKGSITIFNLLKEKGYDFSNHLYLWEWTTNDVIGPANDSKFFELIAILEDMGYLPAGQNVLKFAEEKWALMRELKRFHQRAGVYIRNELLEEMRRVLEEGITINDQLTLNLKGVSSGTLSVLRVVGVDPESQTLPYHEVGVIRKIWI